MASNQSAIIIKDGIYIMPRAAKPKLTARPRPAPKPIEPKAT